MQIQNEPTVYGFGTFPPAFEPQQVLTNVTELIWSETAEDILYALGVPEHRYGKTASDYDRFSALCQAIPAYKGHFYLSQCNTVLTRTFGVDICLSADCADAVWKDIADRLQHTVMTRERFCSILLEDIPTVCLAPTVKEVQHLPTNCRPVLNSDALLQPAKDQLAMQNAIHDTFDQVAQTGCQTAFIALREDVCQAMPDPYHVDLALAAPSQTAEQKALLKAQVFRVLSMECQTRNWKLILQTDADFEQTTAFLMRMERAVGLPELCWIIQDPTVPQQLIPWARKNISAKVSCAIRASDYPTQQELCKMISRTAERYPLGALTVLCTESMCMVP